MDQGVNAWVVAVLTSLVLVLGTEPLLKRSAPSVARVALPAVSFLALVCLLTFHASDTVDVKLFVNGGLDALAAGRSPYGITVENIYPPALAELFYGPGVVQGDRVNYGFPYLPALLLVDLPVHLFVGAVWMHLAAMTAAVLLAWRLASDRLGIAAVMMLALSPSLPFLLVNYYVEPLMIGMFVLVVWAMRRSRKFAVIGGLALFFASKQYAVFYVPALWSVARWGGWRVVLSATCLGALIVGVFVLMDPLAFWRSAVELQLIQPFRDDSLSVLPSIKDALGEPPAWMLVLLTLLGLAVSALVAARTRPGPTSFALCVGLGLLASVLFAKQAFANYYLLCGAALLLAGITWPEDDPVQAGSDA